MGNPGACSGCVHMSKTDYTTNFFQDKIYYCDIQKKYVKPSGYCGAFEERPSYSGGGGCYLTSACVEYLGKADDCEELTLLRKFRDEYMKTTEEGMRLVEEYYAVAPKIVERIDASGKQKIHYNYIYSVIKRCIADIKAGQNALAQEEYRKMTCKLKNDLLE